MTTTTAPKPIAKGLFLTRYPHVEVSVFSLALACLIVSAFAVPAGARAHYGLLGAIIATLFAVLSTVSFLRCPRRPIWAKSVTLVLAFPTLYLAVDADIRCILFVL
jgi:hypothetical protein